MGFTSYSLKHRPDQTAYDLNTLAQKVEAMSGSIRIVSEDKKTVIIIGNQPIDPDTGRPYSFGIHTYNVLGDRLEEV